MRTIREMLKTESCNGVALRGVTFSQKVMAAALAVCFSLILAILPTLG